ncbi:E3 ubiquitin-protein ligase Topors-like [Perognathus longimembris pacificus]|uniref:E3 ubiquitin-protein ligase Topors-like n=1 Tax=Perognathus longimembris pacificus TaxID=214514 RepID=UPI0020198FBD|nr:E3 ubiquitin-protein ligase Topors-like [Perognathus longimembris pacificus]
MPVDLSSDCDCPHCLNCVQSDSEWNLDSRSRSHYSLPYRSGKKSKPSPSTQNLLFQSCSKLEDENKEDPVFVATQKKSSMGFSQKYRSLSSEDVKKKLKPVGEMTIQDLLKEFGDCGTIHPNSMSVGHFRDQVVVKFRRALYYSGIWVKYVQGYKFDKHLSANYFQKNPGSLHRLVPWLKRELTAVYGNYGYTVKNILSAILRHMTEYDLDSGSFIHLLEPYLQQHTHHFLHEFISFVHSPYNMETYDQRAIYQCNPTSTWVQNEARASAPASFWPEDCAPNATQYDTKQSQNTQVQWNREERPQSGRKAFPNGNSSLKNAKIPPVHQETASNIHVCTKDKLKSNGHKGIVSNNNDTMLTWSIPRKKVPGTVDCKNYAQEKKEEGMKLFPGHAEDLQKSETPNYNFSTRESSNEAQPRKFTQREEKAGCTGQRIHFLTKEGEGHKYTKYSPKSFQRWLRGRSLTNCKCKEKDRFWSCLPENFFSPKRGARELSSRRKKRKKCRQSPQFAKFGSHFSRTPKRQSKRSSHRSKSLSVRPRKRSTSRELSDFSLGESHESEHSSLHMCCDWSKEENACGCEANSRRASFPLLLVTLPSTSRKKPDLPSKCEDASQPRSNCSCVTCPQPGIHRSPSKQDMKPQILFPQARKTRCKKTDCHCADMKSMVEEAGELRDLDDKKEMDHLPGFVPFCKRKIHKSQNSSLQRHGSVQNEHRRDLASER